MKSLAIMQPYLFPYLGYFQLINAVDAFVLYDHFDFVKQGWINRNRILAVNQSPFYFNVPMQKNLLPQKRIRDITIKDNHWQGKLLDSINMNYKRSKYFDKVYSVLEDCITYKTNSLSSLNKMAIKKISSYLNIKTEILSDPEFDQLENMLASESSNFPNLFPEIESTTSSKKMIRVVAMCRALNADTFINPIGGVALYPKKEMKQNGIDIHFLKMKDIRYSQNSSEFHQGLSIIDVLMNCGKNRTTDLLNEYSLV